MKRIIKSSLLSLALATVSLAPLSAQAESDFISPGTVLIGCTAGGGASAFAAVLPVFIAVTGGTGAIVTPGIVAAWTGIGCAVGVVSGLVAIGTAWATELRNES